MKKILFALLFLPLFCSAQSANIHHYKLATPTDTTFAVSTGILKVDSAQITINSIQYPTTYTGSYNSELTGYTYNTYTLSNDWSAVLTRFCNGELEAVTVDEGAQVETFYTR